LIDKIGLLDEQFGIGCFEDDDYCRRALAAGYRAVIARDAFVHHFGGRTFIASGVDFQELMRKNEQLFRAKHEQAEPPREQPQATRAGGPETVSPSYTLRSDSSGGLRLERRHKELSLCMIARDNERTIGAALESVRPYVDEMIVVDTGSTDRTPDIARQL